MKLNPKMGGTNHCLAETSKLDLKGTTMIARADVTHPGASCDDGSCPSMAGVVTTVSADVMKYYSAARL